MLAMSILLSVTMFAQKKILILGSSTSTCFFGPSSLENCYVTRLQRHFEAGGTAVQIDNRAVAGDNVYQGMPLGYQPPAGRQSPRPYNNITEGLQGNPDVVLVNFPSNGYDVFSVDEVLFCLRTIRNTALAAGKPCYITTSQPRNDPESFRTPETRAKMLQIKNSVLGEFGEFAINFWDEIVDDNNFIKPQYNADGTHLNDAGHAVLFTRVRDRNILNSVPPAIGNGLNYRYYEGYWNSLPDFNSISPVKTGTSGNFDLAVRNRNDYFGMVWEGSIRIPVSGYYTFDLSSDDGSKFYFNSGYSSSATPLLNNDGLHGDDAVASTTIYINAGSYPCAASYFEAYGGETMRLYWTGPGIPKQQVPNSAFGGAPQPAQGLVYRYFEGDWDHLPDFNSIAPVKSSATAAIDLSPRNRDDYFGFVWEGNLTVPASGNYTFEVESDDGSKFWFNGNYNAYANPTVNNDGLHGDAPAAQSTIYINAGTYPIAAAYFEKWGGEAMRVYWSGPGVPRQLISPGSLTRTNATGPVAAFAQSEAGAGVSGPRPGLPVPPLVLYPNPVTEKINVSFTSKTNTSQGSIQLYNLDGRLIKSLKAGKIFKGQNNVNVRLDDLRLQPGAAYLIRLNIPGEPSQTARLLKK